MYWDNNRIADYYASDSARSERSYNELRTQYVNSLYIIDAIWVFDERAFEDGDLDGEFTFDANATFGALDTAVYTANRALNSEFDLDEDIALSFIEKDSYVRIVGCANDEGADAVCSVLHECRKFGIVEIFFS